MLRENILLALESLRLNKMRAILTMLGIIIGIASVITIMTVGNGLTKGVSDAMQSLGGNNISIYIEEKDMAYEEGGNEEEGTGEEPVFGTVEETYGMTDDDFFTAEMIRDLCDHYPDEIQAISVEEGLGSVSCTYNNQSQIANLTGVTAGYFYANNLTMIRGSYFSDQDLDRGSNVVLISDKFAKTLFGDVDRAMGSTFECTVDGQHLEMMVTGIYQYQKDTMMSTLIMGEADNAQMYMPLKAARMIYGEESGNQYYWFDIVTKQGVDSESFAQTAQKYLADTYYYDNQYVQPSAFSMTSIVDEMSGVMGKITLAISAIAAIALVVGGIGVMNIMLVSITERTREIGTRKALGATNASIRMQFITEAIIICLLGGVIGIVIGSALGMIATAVMGALSGPTPFSILLSLGVAMAVGIFFGYYPANKAAKMNPIDALRYE